MTRYKPFVLLLVVLLVTPSVALGAVTGKPVLSVSLADNEVSPGESTALELTVTNEGELTDSSLRNPSLNSRVTSARGLTVDLRAGESPLDVKTRSRAVGTLPEGTSPPLPFRITVPEGTEPGTYRLPVTLSYTYTENIDEGFGVQTEKSVTKTEYVRVEVVDEARFEVSDVSSSVGIGDRGEVSVTLTNVGTTTARDASVTVSSGNSQLTFGETPSASSYVGAWEPGESRTLTYRADVASTAERRSFSLSAVVDYDDDEGVAVESDALSFGVTPAPEQEFAIENVQSTLRVGEEGALNGTVVNEGPETARNVVVVFEPTNPTINPVETEVALGTLAAGEEADFDFSTEVTSAAEDGPRQFTMQVRYRNADGDRRESDGIDVQAAVGPKRNEFTVEGVNTTLTSGSAGRIEVTVTNNRDEPLSDISAKLYTESPLSTSDDEAFIERLAPGESRTVVFGASAGGSALEKTYPVKLDFRYDDAEGETHISDTYQVPVQITEPVSSGPSPVLIGGGVVALLLVFGGVYYYLRG